MPPASKKSCEKIWISKKEPYLWDIKRNEKQKPTTMSNVKFSVKHTINVATEYHSPLLRGLSTP